MDVVQLFKQEAMNSLKELKLEISWVRNLCSFLDANKREDYNVLSKKEVTENQSKRAQQNVLHLMFMDEEEKKNERAGEQGNNIVGRKNKKC